MSDFRRCGYEFHYALWPTHVLAAKIAKRRTSARLQHHFAGFEFNIYTAPPIDQDK